MEKNYEYPLDLDWQKDELVDVVQLWRLVELAYEKGVEREKFLTQYALFKKVVPSKGEEKRWGNKFEDASGYSLYQVVKTAKASNKKIIRL
ncbi:UPF0223 family protein [Desemzia sp. RIT804]|uniref:UPF0223 family protein n=1 Tax=Desemzia sp. RIT 804 TaxID=2810209 RepID=UPI0019509095|nr:UPF0223 family protein [Desemzia sp. RIT 804]MBM6613611.1 UPF0223 family protein [Desemzia sp. RIT 804]